MGYQALLFCPDEKLANVVTQVFNELDFSVEAVHEPFAAVKKLMAQHYDALVVNSENEQNASLLFKSARNSSFNQSSLAIALVEGQIGVAKAYRIGANLVLTKPINVEQAKGTLRVARGLLRKHSDPGVSSGGVAASALPSESSAALKATPQQQGTAASANHASPGELSTPAQLASATLSAEYARNFPTEFAGEFPELNATVRPETVRPENRGTVPTAAAPTSKSMAAPAAVEAQKTSASIRAQSAVDSETIGKSAGPLPVPATSSGFKSLAATTSGSTVGSATAPALAKEASPAFASENRIVEAEPEKDSSGVATVSSLGSSGALAAPLFAGLGEPESDQPGGNKKFLIAAAIVVALAVVGYLGYSKSGAPKAIAPAAQPASAPADSSQPAPALQPMSSPDSSPAKTNSTTLASQTSRTPAAASLGNATLVAGGTLSTTRAAESVGAEAGSSEKKSASPPMLVRSNARASNSQQRAQGKADKVNDNDKDKDKDKDDEAEPLLALASANDGKLSGLMSSVQTTLPKPSLATLKVSQGVSQGLLIKRVTPTYPKTALATHVEGAVLIEATINKDGSVTNTKVLSGVPVLAQAALDAVRQWRYKPYYLDGTPVDIQTQITVNFKAH
jgi:TonB family protein